MSSNLILIKAFSLDSGIKKVNFDDFEEKDKVYYSIDTIDIYNNDFFENINISGWAFSDSDLSGQDTRKVSLLLKSDDNCYELQCSKSQRDDVNKAFPDLNVPKQAIFRAQFYTLPLSVGEYELWIYVKENDNTYGKVYTGKNFDVTYEGFIEHVNKIVDNFDNIVKSKDVIKSIDSFDIKDDGTTEISGWALMKNVNSNNEKVYVEFTLKNGEIVTKEASKVMRGDVGDYFNDEKYDYSGFNVSLLPEELNSEILNYRIILEYNNSYYTNE